ncbi:O-Antigen ligase [Rosistilla ulvae]|uniref:O-Antigen ligase n=1 Tax=Rosistilla ulvae TaxID=1930277 RepID=A0A517LUN8_9BACT|nr:O-antigen ligase family protein [Rosistilla ulvae]QDS86345.1 O-Antigen ligase [Rosistilla ulvae]
MAKKKQRLTTTKPKPPEPSHRDGRSDASAAPWPPVAYAGTLARFGIAALLIATLMAPADSTAVEQGSATYLSLLTLPLAIAAFFYWPAGPTQGRRTELLLLALVVWVGLATWSVAGRGNLRFAINEFWVWLGCLATYAATRRAIVTTAQKQCLTIVLLASLTTLAVHTIHQKYISIPASIEQYRQDPDGQLRLAGLDAPAGSALRYQYEGRLFAAESMATFSLSTSAAVILFMGLTIAGGMVLWRQKLQLTQWQTVAAALATALLAWGILTTGSRIVLILSIAAAITMLACRFVGGALSNVAFRSAKGSSAERTFAERKATLVPRLAGAVAVACALGGTCLGAAITHSPALLAKFPLSVQFRFQYWASSLRMLGDHLWFGAGPGNFQSTYPRFKAASMSEMIADPHNFLLESATAAGLPVGIHCLAILWSLAAAWSRSNAEKHSAKPTNDQEGSSQRSGSATNGTCDWAICGGALLSVVSVWFLGPWFGVAPDIEPYLISIPLAATFVYFMAGWFGTDVDWEAIAWPGCFAVLAALLFSGGWTTPGIAIPLWALIGAISSRQLPAEANARTPRQLSLLAGLGLLALFSTTTLTPVMQTLALTQSAGDRIATGDAPTAIQLLRQATEADRWDAGPAMQLESVLTRVLMQQSTATARQEWQQAKDEVLRRDPANPRAWQQLAESQLRIYHRWGDRQDLLAALESSEIALRLDPTSIQITAQVAVFAAASGENRRAEEAWQQAARLAEVNKNIESDWNLLQVLPADRPLDGRNPLESISVQQAWANRNQGPTVEND